jgi:hypothetical protein
MDIQYDLRISQRIWQGIAQKSQQMTKYGRKFSIKWKTARLIPRKFIHQLDIQGIIHAKFGVIWMWGSV